MFTDLAKLKIAWFSAQASIFVFKGACAKTILNYLDSFVFTERDPSNLKTKSEISIDIFQMEILLK